MPKSKWRKVFNSDEDFSSKLNPVCRLCRDSYESRYERIFSKAGSSKDLCAEVHKTCGIKISEDDTGSKVLCRGCVFIRRQDGTVYLESPIHREYALRSKLRICCKAMCSAFTFSSAVEAFFYEYVIRMLRNASFCPRGHINKKAAFLLNSTSCDNFYE